MLAVIKMVTTIVELKKWKRKSLIGILPDCVVKSMNLREGQTVIIEIKGKSK